MERFRTHQTSLRLLACTGTLGFAVLISLARSPEPAYASSNATHHGAELFATSGCAHCHGAEGMGTERGPRLRELRKHLSAAEIEHQIVSGGKEMPAFGDTLDHGQVEDLVAFLRAKKWVTLPATSHAPDGPAPAPSSTP